MQRGFPAAVYLGYSANVNLLRVVLHLDSVARTQLRWVEGVAALQLRHAEVGVTRASHVAFTSLKPAQILIRRKQHSCHKTSGNLIVSIAILIGLLYFFYLTHNTFNFISSRTDEIK